MRIRVPCLADVRKIEFGEQEIGMQPDQVLVKHVCTAPSQGTALHMYRGEHLQVKHLRRERPWPYPWLQGFAYGVGRVEDVGSQVQGFKAEELVYCEKLVSDYSVVAPASLTLVPEGLDPEMAALSFQAMVALNCVREAEVALGDAVLVAGQGPIGIFAAQLCKLAGAWRVIATDLYDRKVAISREVGIDMALNALTDDVIQSVYALTDGRGVDLAMEASGSPKGLMQCFAAARRLARVAVIGMIVDTFTLNLYEDFSSKGLELLECRRGRGGGPRQCDRLRGGTSFAELRREARAYLFDLLREGRLRAKELVTHRFPFQDLEEAWRFIDTQRGEYCQVLLVS